MHILLTGAGRIGSTFAFYLARAGHTVDVLARGQRQEELQRDLAIVSVDGTRAPVRPVATIDPRVPYDLVLVTVAAHQVAALIPALVASAATTILFMFNTFEPTSRWRDALGGERLVHGFPNMTAFLEDGRLRSVVDGPGMVTTLSSAHWAGVLRAAGLPTEVEPDMDSFLRTHVAFFLPLLLAALLTWQRASALSWAEARQLTAALREGFALVRALDHAIKPRFVAALARLPGTALAGLIWAFSRTAAVRNLGAFGPGEARALIDAMAAAGPGRVPHLLALRPR